MVVCVSCVLVVQPACVHVCSVFFTEATWLSIWTYPRQREDDISVATCTLPTPFVPVAGSPKNLVSTSKSTQLMNIPAHYTRASGVKPTEQKN